MSSLAVMYDQDFYHWAMRNAELLKQGRFAELDVAHLAEELESMAKVDRKELVSRLIVLIAHLLKWQHQLGQLSEIWEKFQGSSWRASIIEQRVQISLLMRQNPSLKPFFSQAINEAYPLAVKLAGKETGLPKNTFPGICPYRAADLLDDDFFPEPEKKCHS